MYADDLKLYIEARDDDAKRELQYAITAVSSWCKQNRMELSASKCAILKTSPDAMVYILDNHAIPEVSAYRDLGVTFDRHMKFSTHICETAKSAARMCNLILRALIRQDPNMYLKLYESLVVPKWMYCAHVWSPFYQKDVALLQRVQDRFVKRVAYRCNISRDKIVLPTVAEYQRRVDINVLKYLLHDRKIDNFFAIRPIYEVEVLFSLLKLLMLTL